jgi:hypothetical protein
MSIFTSYNRLISLFSEIKEAAISLGFGQEINDSIKN